jgi:nicotinate phosphoribosyltransferase
VAEVVTAEPVQPHEGDRDLLVPLVRGGALVRELDPRAALEEARALHARVRETLPAEAWALSRGEPVLETVTE